jgi:hypothetical protein
MPLMSELTAQSGHACKFLYMCVRRRWPFSILPRSLRQYANPRDRISEIAEGSIVAMLRPYAVLERMPSAFEVAAGSSVVVRGVGKEC